MKQNSSLILALVFIGSCWGAEKLAFRQPHDRAPNSTRVTISERTSVTVHADGTQTTEVFNAAHPNGIINGPIEGQQCIGKVLQVLRLKDPEGAHNYDRLVAKAVFLTSIHCDEDELILSIPQAVHESTHALLAQNNAFALINGVDFPKVDDGPGFMKPENIIPYVDQKNHLVADYLTGNTASSKELFFELIDELNAYARGLETATRLNIPERMTTERFSVLTMMGFVKTYASVSQTTPRYQATFQALLEPNRARLIRTLWQQADIVLNHVCAADEKNESDPAAFLSAYGPTRLQAITQILGYVPAIPKNCVSFAGF